MQEKIKSAQERKSAEEVLTLAHRERLERLLYLWGLVGVVPGSHPEHGHHTAHTPTPHSTTRVSQAGYQSAHQLARLMEVYGNLQHREKRYYN